MAVHSVSDLSALTSSAQVFTSPQHTLPQIRAIHKALHAQMDDRAARLRTQVGTSYRDLLGTADAIVRMRRDMEAVQSALGRMGGRCGRAVIDAKAEGLGRFIAQAESLESLDAYPAMHTAASTRDAAMADRRHGGGGGGGGGSETDTDTDADAEGEGEGEGGVPNGLSSSSLSSKGRQLAASARARLLEACTLAADRVLRVGLGASSSSRTAAGDGGGRRGDRLLVAAKVLLLHRLVAKSFGDEVGLVLGLDPRVRELMDASRESLKRRLLRTIAKLLEKASDAVDREDVLNALCAYSLATSSGARDVLRHFLSIRAWAMTRAFEAEEGGRDRGSEDVLNSLNLYTRTLLDVQALVPVKLTEALLGLKRKRLLEDEALLGLEGLRLDIDARWCGEEMGYFKPYIRHDDLDWKQAKEMLASWAATGGDELLGGLERTLGRLHELKAIAALRTSVLQRWIRDGGRARGFDPAVVLDRLRDAINAHLLETLTAKVQKLRLVGSEVAATLERWQEGFTDRRQDLWDEEGFDMELSGGAAQFTNDVLSRLYGRNDAVSRAIGCYRAWHRVIDEVGEVVGHLRRQRWHNDVDEIEDEETIEQRQRLLSRDDPQLLQDRLDESLEKAFAELDGQLWLLWKGQQQKVVPSDGPNGPNGSKEGQVAMYLVRVLRDMRAQLPDMEATKGFGLALVPGLYRSMAQTVVVSPLEGLSTVVLASNRNRKRPVAGRSLWEGVDPELPTSPSPGVFTFLRSLTTSMGDAGMDLWSPAAVIAMKAHLRKELSERWHDALNAHRDHEEEDEEEEEEKEKIHMKEDGAEPKRNGDGQGEEEQGGKRQSPPFSPEQRRDLMIQWLFDISLLRCCLGPSPAEVAEDELKALEEVIYQRTTLESVAARQRLVKSSHEFWKRTGLLFGLLA